MLDTDYRTNIFMEILMNEDKPDTTIKATQPMLPMDLKQPSNTIGVYVIDDGERIPVSELTESRLDTLLLLVQGAISSGNVPAPDVVVEEPKTEADAQETIMEIIDRVTDAIRENTS